MTYANCASLVRIIFGPPFALILYLTVKFPGKYPALEEHWPFLISLIMFLVLALTDALDGRLAKKYGETRFGAFLDPLADKIFLWSYSAVFVFTVAWNAILPLVLLFVLDVWSTVDRVKWYSLREKEIRANKGGKRKTFFHSLAVSLFILLPLVIVVTGLPSLVLTLICFFPLKTSKPHFLANLTNSSEVASLVLTCNRFIGTWQSKLNIRSFFYYRKYV